MNATQRGREWIKLSDNGTLYASNKLKTSSLIIVTDLIAEIERLEEKLSKSEIAVKVAEFQKTQTWLDTAFMSERVRNDLLYKDLESCKKIRANFQIDLMHQQQRITALEAELEDYKDDIKSILSEVCEDTDDRKHCSCVPSYRKAITVLQANERDYIKIQGDLVKELAECKAMNEQLQDSITQMQYNPVDRDFLEKYIRQETAIDCCEIAKQVSHVIGPIVEQDIRQKYGI